MQFELRHLVITSSIALVAGVAIGSSLTLSIVSPALIHREPPPVVTGQRIDVGHHEMPPITSSLEPIVITPAPEVITEYIEVPVPVEVPVEVPVPVIPTPVIADGPSLDEALITAALTTPCEEEDSIGCYWDATTRGNGVGESFVNIDGHLFPLPIG